MSEEGERRLAAIMFTDMVGFTSMTQSNEALALRLLETQSGILLPLIRAHRGTPVKTIGDAHLAEFGSALEALECAIDIQRRLKTYDAAARPTEGFKLRIGIHVGDVVHRDNDVFGDAVNIASRLQPMADPGGICISQQVFDQVRNKTKAKMERLPFRQLKNVAVPIEIYRVIDSEPGVSFPAEQEMVKERVAVLPLSNFSASPQDEYLADGMTEELITAISGVQGLRVIARTSVMRFKNTQTDVSEIGKTLNVGTILEGSFRKIGDKVRVTVQLVDARTEEHRWASNYDGDIQDIFNIQTDIANRVAQVLRGKLIDQSVVAQRSVSIEAYELYLKGRHSWNKRNPDAISQAFKLFKEASEKDPEMAKAYSGMADCYMIGKDMQVFDQDLADSEAAKCIEKAIFLDESIPEPHASRGLLLVNQHRYAESEIELRRALTLNPSYTSAHHWYAICLSNLGKLDQAIEEARLATQSDPLSPPARNILGVMYLYARRFDDAMKVFDENLKLDPGFPPSLAFRAQILIQRGLYEEATRDWEIAFKSSSEYDRLAFAAFMNCFSGRQEVAEKFMEEARRAAKTKKDSLSLETNYCACMGDAEGFFRLIGQAMDAGAMDPCDLRYGWWMDRVRSDPRFDALLMSLPV